VGVRASGQGAAQVVNQREDLSINMSSDVKKLLFSRGGIIVYAEMKRQETSPLVESILTRSQFPLCHALIKGLFYVILCFQSPTPGLNLWISFWTRGSTIVTFCHFIFASPFHLHIYRWIRISLKWNTKWKPERGFRLIMYNYPFLFHVCYKGEKKNL